MKGTAKTELAEVAGGVVLGPDARILLVDQFGTSWSLPKGHAEPGEDRRATAGREIGEESGIRDLEEVAELGSYQRSAIAADGSIDESRRKRITLFLYRTGQERLRPSDPQNPQARWVCLDGAIELLTHPVDAARLRELEPQLEPHLRAIAAKTALQRAAVLWPEIPEAVLDSYASVLAAEFEDLPATAKLVLDKPYGINVIEASIENFGVSVARLKPGRSSSFHYHHKRRELFTVRRGVLTV